VTKTGLMGRGDEDDYETPDAVLNDLTSSTRRQSVTIGNVDGRQIRANPLQTAYTGIINSGATLSISSTESANFGLGGVARSGTDDEMFRNLNLIVRRDANNSEDTTAAKTSFTTPEMSAGLHSEMEYVVQTIDALARTRSTGLID
jgi:hypothetical protein